MVNIIGIYDGFDLRYDEETPNKTALGGSESWVISISEALAQIPNTHIIVYCVCDYHIHNKYKNIEYIPKEYFLLNNMKYDALIISRRLYQSIIDKIKELNSCNNIYLMTHDINLVYYNDYENYSDILYYDNIINDEFLSRNIKKVFALSDWHQHFLNEEYGFPLEFIEITGHGANEDLLKIDCNIPRDNSILWSNCIWRNFDVLVEEIAPRVLDKFPKFTIYFSHYGVLDNDWNHNYLYLLDYDYVINLGNLNKVNLHNEMIKHKCAFYSNIFMETFCITAMEQAICENQIVMPLRFGPATTFKPYKYMFLNENNFFETEEDINDAANKIINVLNTYYNEYNIAYRQSLKHYLINKYNWNNIGLELFNKMKLFY